MGRGRSSFNLLLLLLAALVPLLFLLDYMVDQGGQRSLWVEAELRVRLDGQEALFLAVPLVPVDDPGAEGLAVEGVAILREDHYPWAATAYEGRFWLRLGPELLAGNRLGLQESGFAASYSVRDTDRADGFGLPPIPCRGNVMVREVVPAAPTGATERLAELDELALNVDLLCTSAGPDLAWGSGDERTWTLEGTLRLRSGQLSR
ncbi:MAG: hypothetical protein H6739_16085 [Alphaproteobacteria bacterium]|nr:hypothetical protein [Alphaproteobacteria bacterium]